jgi:hypothetical protein
MSVVDLQNRRQPFAWLHQRVIFKWKTTQETHTAHAHRQFKKNGRESDAVMAHRPCNSINDVIFAQRVYSKTHFGCNKLIRLKVTKKHTSSATQCVCPSKTNAHNPIERVGSSIKRRIERIQKTKRQYRHTQQTNKYEGDDGRSVYMVHTINGCFCVLDWNGKDKKMRHKKRREFCFFSSSALIQTFNSSDCRPYWCTVRNRLSFRW